MVSKFFIAYAFLLCFTTSVNAHGAPGNLLGVKGQPTRNDVQRPSQSNPCGNVNIAQNLDTSTPILASADGTFTDEFINFNAGADGSRSIKTVQVDASGTGNSFVAGKVLVNGDANPTDVGPQQLKFQLPLNTKCAGGKNSNLCLVSMTTTSGFGGCVVVSQDAKQAKTDPAKSSQPGSSQPAQRAAERDAEDDGAVHTNGDKRHHSRHVPRTLRNKSFKRNWTSRDKDV